MKRKRVQIIGLTVFLLAPFLAILACSGQVVTPTLLTGASPGTQNPEHTATAIQKVISSGTATPTRALSSSSTPDPVGKIGERKASGGVAITVIRITKATQINFFIASVGNTFLDVEILVENVSRSEGLPYNPYYFKMSAPNGDPYPASLSSLEPSLKNGTLNIGERVRGHIAYQVSLTANVFFLSYEPNLYLKDYRVIRFNLGQHSAQPIGVPTVSIAPNQGQLGKRINSDSIALTVVKITSPDVIGVFKPGEGEAYLDAEVILENTSQTEPLPCNSLYFKLKDSDGYEYTTALIALEPALANIDLAPGEKNQGHIAFEVRREARGFTLTYEPVVLFKEYEEVDVDLGE